MRCHRMHATCWLAIAVSVGVCHPAAAVGAGEVAPPLFGDYDPSGTPPVDINSDGEHTSHSWEFSSRQPSVERVFPQGQIESSRSSVMGSEQIYPPFSNSPQLRRVWPPPTWVGGELSSAGARDENAMAPVSRDENSGETLSEVRSVFPAEQPGLVGVATSDEWLLLPRGLMYQSYLAGPREPRFGYAWLYDSDKGVWLNDAAIGARFGVLRYGDCDPILPQGWQLDIEGAAFPRLAESSLDLIATDYRFGIPLTGRRGPLQWKLAYYHLSSHIGDEYLLNTAPDFDRINFSRNAVVLGLGYFLTPDIRLYSEAGYGFLNDGGNQPWEFQFGAEHRPFVPTGRRGAPFVAANAHLREEVDFGGSFNLMAGWAWQGSESSYLLRIGIQYFNGHTSQFEFLGRSEELIGFGMWFDL